MPKSTACGGGRCLENERHANAGRLSHGGGGVLLELLLAMKELGQ